MRRLTPVYRSELAPHAVPPFPKASLILYCLAYHAVSIRGVVRIDVGGGSRRRNTAPLVALRCRVLLFLKPVPIGIGVGIARRTKFEFSAYLDTSAAVAAEIVRIVSANASVPSNQARKCFVSSSSHHSGRRKGIMSSINNAKRRSFSRFPFSI